MQPAVSGKASALVCSGHQCTDRSSRTYLVNEGGKLVVQRLDLLPLLGSHFLDLGVHLYVEGGQEALVDSDLRDASRRAHGWTCRPQAGAAKDGAHKAPQAATSASAVAQCKGATPPGRGAQGQAPGAPQVEEAPAAKGSCALDSSPERGRAAADPA